MLELKGFLLKIESKLETINNFWIKVAVIGISIRLLTVLIGHNYDIESWVIVGNIVNKGGIVYLETFRYTTGPIWCYILGVIYSLHNFIGLNDAISYHFMITIFLSIIDLLIAYLLSRNFKPIAGLIILICPISILISGFHAQFDSFALLVAFVSWIITSKSNKDSNNHILSAILIGVSLTIKHILVFYPLWLMLSNKQINLRNRIIYTFLPYSIFLISFLPFMIEPDIREAVINHVFRYESTIGNSLLGLLLSLLPNFIIKNILGSIPIFSGLKFFFFIGMFITGIVVSRKNYSNIFFFYIISMIVLTPSMADQYLVIPMIAVALFIGHYEMRYYLIFSSIYLIFITPNNIGPHFVPQLIEGAKSFFTSINNSNSLERTILAGIQPITDSVSQISSKYSNSNTLIIAKTLVKKYIFLAYPFLQIWLLIFYVKYIVGNKSIKVS